LLFPYIALLNYGAAVSMQAKTEASSPLQPFCL
jgi:hypothetical protein